VTNIREETLLGMEGIELPEVSSTYMISYRMNRRISESSDESSVNSFVNARPFKRLRVFLCEAGNMSGNLNTIGEEGEEAMEEVSHYHDLLCAQLSNIHSLYNDFHHYEYVLIIYSFKHFECPRTLHI
jgi:hypothetical protein